ncbi:cation efflux family-domain-containing protein [Tribonema minus]|uniref:Cation efflux family-domain-containing protein n=1 Tax=Tribonema minus TaxID=303371 RepID=A0A836CEW4_9STRA|nr:cation efflux family-domain-containing protein [Tribonema minus]
MMAEALHSSCDLANQGLLLQGLRSSATAPDSKHQYGYGKSLYFWSLVSALGTFYGGCGASLVHSLSKLFYFSSAMQLELVGPETWGVLAVSLAVDGYVLHRSVQQINATRKPGVSFLAHLKKVRDPATLSILFEDGAACLGVLTAAAGIGLSQYYQNPVYDALGGVVVAGLLGCVGYALANVSYGYLIGKSVDSDTVDGIYAILMARPGIENVKSVQSQYIGPYTFSYKAEIDFDGTYLAAQLIPHYESLFNDLKSASDPASELHVLLALYAEDVARVIEREVKAAEAAIRETYPEAAFIELEPDSSKTDKFAVEDFHLASFKSQEVQDVRKMMYKALNVTVSVKTKLPPRGGKGRAQ